MSEKLKDEVLSMVRELQSYRLVRRSAIPDDLDGLYRQLVFLVHPDRGGSDELLQRVTALFDALKSPVTLSNRALLARLLMAGTHSLPAPRRLYKALPAR